MMLPSLLPVLAQAFSLTLGVENQDRIRADQFGAHFDNVLNGTGSISLSLKRTDWTLTYAPSFILYSIGERTNSMAMLLNTGRIAANLQLTSRTSLYLQETAIYGYDNVQVLATSRLAPNALANNGGLPGNGGTQPAPTDTGQVSAAIPAGNANLPSAPSNATIQYGSTSTSIGLTQVLSHRWSAAAFASYSVSGQIGSKVYVTNSAEPYIIFPNTRTLTFQAQTTRNYGVRDSVSLLEYFNRTLTEPTARALIATTAVSWHHLFSRTITGTLTVGESYTDSIAFNGNHSTVLLPVVQGEANRSQKFGGGRLTSFASAGFIPVVDRNFGTVYEALRFTVGGTWVGSRCLATAFAYSSSILESYSQISMLAGYGGTEEITCAIERRKHWFASVGGYESWQSYVIGQPRTLFAAAFVSLAYRTGVMPL